MTSIGDLWVTIAIGLLRGIAFIYDLIAFVPLQILRKPQRKLKSSNRLKGKSTHEIDPNAPYRTVDSLTKLTTTPFPECNSLDDLFSRSVDIYRGLKCLGTRELLSEEDEMQPNGKVFSKAVFGQYKWKTYAEVNDGVVSLASGLIALDSSDGQPKRSNICIFAETRAEWIISILACFKSNLPAVTLYATLGDDAVIHGLNETEAHTVITSLELLNKFKNLLPQLPNVKHIVYFEGGAKNQKVDVMSYNGVKLHSLSSIQEFGNSASSLTEFAKKKKVPTAALR